MATLRHEFYETDDHVNIDVFDKNVKAENLSITFEPRKLVYTNGDKELVLQPLKGQIDPDASTYTIRSVKVEIRLVKRAHLRWGALVGDAPDALVNNPPPVAPVSSDSDSSSAPRRKTHKNWDGITDSILSAEKEKTQSDDPNVAGDTVLNSFFQKIYADADEDTRRAMVKSFSESGGTTLSTNWEEVRAKRTEVKPPAGAELKKWY